MALIEIDGLPFLTMVDLSMAMSNNQRVCTHVFNYVVLALPTGKKCDSCLHLTSKNPGPEGGAAQKHQCFSRPNQVLQCWGPS